MAAYDNGCIPNINEIVSFFTDFFLKSQGVIAFLKHGVYSVVTSP